MGQQDEGTLPEGLQTSRASTGKNIT